MSLGSDVFEQRMRDAEAAKSAGNAALAVGNAKSASFHYKRVYLYLAEYLPASMAASTLGSGATAPASSSSSPSSAATNAAGREEEEGEPADGFIGFLQKRRQQQQRQASNGSSIVKTEAEREAEKAAKAQQLARLYALYGATLNNLTLANYKLSRLREGVATATCLLDKVPGFELSPKALLRRAYCWVGLQCFTEADADVAALEHLVSLAANRCKRNTPQEQENEESKRENESEKKEADGEEKEDALDGLGGMTIAAVAAMQSELPALRQAVQHAKQTTATKQKKMYQRMFAP